MMMDYDKRRFEQLLLKVNYPRYTFTIGDGWLQGEYIEADVITGESNVQKTRKWVLSPWMTDSEFVQTVFKCVLTSAEHRVREHFKYRNQPVYMPHYDVEALHALCERKLFDYRVEPQGEPDGKP